VEIMSLNVPDYLQARVGEILNIAFNEALYRENLAVILQLAPVKDGDHWVVLHGPNIQEGVAGFGKTPWAAMQAFHEAMLSEKAKP
jgi:hypothetical protein